MCWIKYNKNNSNSNSGDSWSGPIFMCFEESRSLATFSGAWKRREKKYIFLIAFTRFAAWCFVLLNNNNKILFYAEVLRMFLMLLRFYGSCIRCVFHVDILGWWTHTHILSWFLRNSHTLLQWKISFGTLFVDGVCIKFGWSNQKGDEKKPINLTK